MSMNCQKFRDNYDQYSGPLFTEDRPDLNDWKAWQEHALACSSCYDWDLQVDESEKGDFSHISCGHLPKFIKLEKGQTMHPHDCPGNLITRDENTQSYGLPISDSATTLVTIHFCPWCGTKLGDT